MHYIQIIEYLQLEGTYKDYWVQLPAPRRTPKPYD